MRQTIFWAALIVAVFGSPLTKSIEHNSRKSGCCCCPILVLFYAFQQFWLSFHSYHILNWNWSHNRCITSKYLLITSLFKHILHIWTDVECFCMKCQWKEKLSWKKRGKWTSVKKRMNERIIFERTNVHIFFSFLSLSLLFSTIVWWQLAKKEEKFVYTCWNWVFV